MYLILIQYDLMMKWVAPFQYLPLHSEPVYHL